MEIERDRQWKQTASERRTGASKAERVYAPRSVQNQRTERVNRGWGREDEREMHEP